NTSDPSNSVIVDTATDTTPPAAGENSIAFGDGDDGFLNADEIGNVTLSGTIEDGLDSGNVQLVITDGEGGSVTIDTADITVEGTNLIVAGQDLSGLAEGELTATLTVTDNAGNSAEFLDTSTKDTTSPGGEGGTDAPVLTIDEAADGVTAAELADGLQTSVTLTTGTEEGDTVTVTLDDGNGGTITGEA
ncbi:hypothetical protein QQF40_17010, partial [Cobetia sp. LC6]|uniref:hypothetical protein n=1 Tax=Cobetia sp. LC6 TaxID=3050947 RepID=UPI002553AD67